MMNAINNLSNLFIYRTMNNGNKFFISNVASIDNDAAYRQVISTFPEGVNECIKEMIFDTDEDAPEEEEVLCFIDGQSISGVKVSKLKDGDTSVFLGWNASGMDVHMCFEYLKAVKDIYPEAVITCADAEGNKTAVPADLGEEALQDAWGRRVEMIVNLMQLDEEVVRIPAIRHTYILHPKEFAEETKELDLGDKIRKLYGDIIELQWYNTPEPNVYILRWNTEISNFKIKDFEESLDNFNEFGEYHLSWSIWDWQNVRVGDIVYLLRVGEGKTGIVMRGTIESEPYVDEDWSGKGRVTRYVSCRMDKVMHPEKAVIPTTEKLQECFEDVEWTGGHSGTIIPHDTAYELEKFFDRYLVDNRNQFAVAENNGIAITESYIDDEYPDYFDTHQGHGAHWSTILNPEKVDLMEFVQKRVAKSKHTGTYPVDDLFEEDGNILSLATEDEEICMRSLILEEEDSNEFISAYPENVVGTEVEMKLLQIHEYDNGFEAVLTCETEDGTELSFFDTHYHQHSEDYVLGRNYKFCLAALALEAEVLPEDERFMSLSAEQTIEMAEAFGTELEYDDESNVISHSISVDQLAYCLPMAEEVPDRFEFQSPVSNAKATKVLGTPMYRMDIIAVRTEDEPAALSIPLFAKKSFFEKKPKKNEPVRGVLWMIGHCTNLK